MIARLGLVILAGGALALPGQTVDGTISLTLRSAEGQTTFLISPTGALTIQQTDANGTTRETKGGGPANYRRVKALVEPVRRWAGGRVPCDPAAGDGPTIGAAVVRWESDGRAVKVPLTCMRGPAENEIELIRAAFDSLREWAKEDSYPWDPAANVVAENMNSGSDR